MPSFRGKEVRNFAPHTVDGISPACFPVPSPRRCSEIRASQDTVTPPRILCGVDSINGPHDCTALTPDRSLTLACSRHVPRTSSQHLLDQPPGYSFFSSPAFASASPGPISSFLLYTAHCRAP